MDCGRRDRRCGRSSGCTDVSLSTCDSILVESWCRAKLRGDMNFANAGALKERLRRLERFGHSPHHPSSSPKREEARLLVLHMVSRFLLDEIWWLTFQKGEVDELG